MVPCRRVIYCVYTLAFQSSKVHPCLLKRWNVPTNVARCERELGLPTLVQVRKWTVEALPGLRLQLSASVPYRGLGMLINPSMPQFSVCKMGIIIRLISSGHIHNS